MDNSESERENRLILATVKRTELKRRIDERDKRKEEKKEQEHQVQKKEGKILKKKK